MQRLLSWTLILCFAMVPMIAFAASDTAYEAVPLTGGQEVAVQWGSWVGIGLDALQKVGLAVIPIISAVLLSFIPGWLRLFIPASRVNQLVENAVKSAIASIAGATAGKKITVNVTNDIIRQAIVYMLSQAPALVNAMGNTLPALIQKVLARLPAHVQIPPNFKIEDAVKTVTPASVKQKAESQKINLSEEVNKYLGGGK